MPVTRSEKKRKDPPPSDNGIPHVDTPKKARLRQTVAMFERTGPTKVYRSKADIFNHFNVSETTGHELLNDVSDRTTPAQKTRERHENTS